MAKKVKGINARAWFYSQSFVSSALGLDPAFEEARDKRMAELKAELAKLEAEISQPKNSTDPHSK